MMMTYVYADQLLSIDNLNTCSRYFGPITFWGIFVKAFLLIRYGFKPKKFVKLFNSQESLKKRGYICLYKRKGVIMLGTLKSKKQVAPAKILIVDDEPDIVSIIQCHLEC
jgi:hypothetical protein